MSALSSMMLSPGVAGAVLLGHTALTKMMMTLIWRGPGSKSESIPGWENNWFSVKDKLKKVPGYQIMSGTQLNEAEYAPVFISALFFCSLQNIDVPIASTLAVFGQIMYFWPRVLLASPGNFNNGFPFYVPAALARYASLFMLAWAIYAHVSA